MMFTKALSLAGALSVATAHTSSQKYYTQAQVDAARNSVEPYSPVSHVKGVSFDRFVDIWLENTDFSNAASDPNMAKLAEQGITLTNYFATTHPSEPNYCASAGGDNFGMDNDDFNQIPQNVSTLADLFDTREIAWGEYQEDMPYPGYQGYKWPNSGPVQYVRKHNPLILFDSVTKNNTRLRQIKNFTSFYDDLENEQLPQYMFITPNMTNDAHDTNITVAGRWSEEFLTPLLENKQFNDNTLVLLTFDEVDTYPKPNRVFSILLGSAVPECLKGTTDDTFYTHYSVIASLSANWRLPSLGRWDCGANLLKQVADETGYVNWEVEYPVYLNQTYPGPMSVGEYSEYSPQWPAPATHGQCSAGHGIADIVQETWGDFEPTYNYTSPVPYDSASGTNVGIKYHRTLQNGKTESGST